MLLESTAEETNVLDSTSQEFTQIFLSTLIGFGKVSQMEVVFQDWFSIHKITVHCTVEKDIKCVVAQQFPLSVCNIEK